MKTTCENCQFENPVSLMIDDQGHVLCLNCFLKTVAKIDESLANRWRTQMFSDDDDGAWGRRHGKWRPLLSADEVQRSGNEVR